MPDLRLPRRRPCQAGTPHRFIDTVNGRALMHSFRTESMAIERVCLQCAARDDPTRAPARARRTTVDVLRAVLAQLPGDPLPDEGEAAQQAAVRRLAQQVDRHLAAYWRAREPPDRGDTRGSRPAGPDSAGGPRDAR